MKLPNRAYAHIADEKIVGYLLNLEHPKGRGKAAFFNLYGFSTQAWKVLADALLAHAQVHEVTKVEQTAFGVRYIIEGELEAPVRRNPSIRAVWFIGLGSSVPRLVTAYPVEEKDDSRA